jgi:hypothetical protein
VSFIRRNPFNDIDPSTFAIERLAAQAELDGEPLSDSERRWLAAEHDGSLEIPEQIKNRLQCLAEKLVAAEKRDPPRGLSLGDALEWGSDMRWPYVMALLAVAFTGTPQDGAPLRRSNYSVWWLVAPVLLLFIVAVVAWLRS